MAKFGKSDPNAEPAAPKPAMDEVVAINTSTTITTGPAPAAAPAAPVTAQAQVIQAEAQAEMDKKILESQLAKQEEHWMKSYWRPAMGWLYMIICFVDFVAFPVISMFLPVMIKGLQYVPWKSITLDNGGLIHLAFGAILGVTAYGRTMEKKTGTN